jgi:hypothetical protein
VRRSCDAKEEWKKILTVATVVARNKNELQWRLWCSLAEFAFDEGTGSSGRFCVGTFERNLASIDNMFSYLISFM